MSSKKAIATKTLRAKNDEELLKELRTLRVKYSVNIIRKNYKILDLLESQEHLFKKSQKLE